MNPVVWLITAVVLVSLEMLLPSTYLLWLGVGAAFTSLFTMVFGVDSLLGQGLIFAAMSVLALYTAHRRAKQRPALSKTDLNDRYSKVVGRVTVVPDDFHAKNAYINIDDTRWVVTPDQVSQFESGEVVEVVSLDDGQVRLRSKTYE